MFFQGLATFFTYAKPLISRHFLHKKLSIVLFNFNIIFKAYNKKSFRKIENVILLFQISHSNPTSFGVLSMKGNWEKIFNECFLVQQKCFARSHVEENLAAFFH